MAEDLFTLQQEALRRAREMHARSTPIPQPQPTPQRRQQQQAPPAPIIADDHNQVHNNTNIQEKPPDLLEALFKDKDKTIILALLILLSGENGDNSLLFALMYLLM